MQTVTKQLQKALITSVLTLFFYLSGIFAIATPLPLLYLSLTEDKTTWRISVLFLFLFAFLFYLHLLPFFVQSGDIARIRFLGLAYLYSYMVVTFFLSLAIWRRWSWNQFGLHGALGTTAILCLTGLLVQQFGLFDVRGLIALLLQEAYQLLEKVVQTPEFRKDQELTLAFLSQMRIWIAFVPKLLPAFIFIVTLTVSLCNVGLLKIFRKIAPRLHTLGEFQKWELPHSCLWILLAAGSGYFLNDYLLRLPWVKIAALNLLLAALFVYGLQGLGILGYWLRRFSPLFRWGIYGLVMVFLQIGGLVLVGLGIADVWLDLRKLRRNHGSHS